MIPQGEDHVRLPGHWPAETVEHLARWDTDKRFSDAERACLAFTEVYAMDAQALTDEHAEAVKSHFGDAGMVLLVEELELMIWHLIT